MSDQTDRLEPALTPEEWAAMEAVRPGETNVGDVRLYAAPEEGLFGIAYAADKLFIDNINAAPAAAPAMMALANAARDDSDPGKLTWAMVDAIRVAGTPESLWYREDPVLLATAEAIAVLLPPRGQG